MLKNISPAQLVGMWCAAVIVIGMCSVVGGAAITIGNGELWLITCLVPPAAMRLAWRNPAHVDVTLKLER